MYSFSLSRFSFFTKTKRHIKTFPAVIPVVMFSGSPTPTPHYSYMLHSRTSGFPHMLWRSPTRVEFWTPRLKYTKGVGADAECVA